MATIIDRCFKTTAYLQGGSFEKAMLDAWYLASWSNRARIEGAFPEMFPEDMMSVGTDNRHEFMDIFCYDEWKRRYDESKKIGLTPMLRQYYDLKAKHADAVLLFRCGDFYETYCQDASTAADILGITLTKSSKTKELDGKPLRMAGFPYHALDTYLPKLIRAGKRVAIADQLEDPKKK